MSSLCHRVTVSPCHCVTVSLCHRVTVSPCHSVTVSLCHRVTLSPCHRVTVFCVGGGGRTENLFRRLSMKYTRLSMGDMSEISECVTT